MKNLKDGLKFADQAKIIATYKKNVSKIRVINNSKEIN